MIKNGETVKREKVLGKSRIDFATVDTFLEVKTLMNQIPMATEHKSFVPYKKPFGSATGRLIKHMSELSELQENSKKGIVVLCHLFDAAPFRPPEPDPKAKDSKIRQTVQNAISKGVENWQVNLKIDKEGVELIDYFPLDFSRQLMEPEVKKVE